MAPGGEIAARLASADDLELLVAMRLEYIRADLDAGSDLDAIAGQLRTWIPLNLGERFFAVLAGVDDTPAAVAMLAVNEFPANPGFPNGRVGTVLNVWTRPRYRRLGLARATVGRVIQLGRQQGLSRLELLSSEMGLSLYESLGFALSEDDHIALQLRL